MPPVKQLPPKESKTQLMEQIGIELVRRVNREETQLASAFLFLMEFFTAVDLVMIRDELNRRKK